MMSQANAVVVVTAQTLGERYSKDVPVKNIFTIEDERTIVGRVCGLFKSGEVGFSQSRESNKEKMSDDKELAKYVIGLCNNHWRKHKLLNGGVKYEPKFKRGESNVESLIASIKKIA